jgi:hypothetical protein
MTGAGPRQRTGRQRTTSSRSKTMTTSEQPKGQRTEWIVREYDAEGDLVTETVTVKTVVTPKADAQPELPTGMYL